MADLQFTAALNVSSFPFVSRFARRSVLVPGLDNNLRSATSGVSGIDRDNNTQNMPAIVYCENIMPTDAGVQSVGFDEIEASVAGEVNFDDVLILRNSTEVAWAFSPARGKNYIIPIPAGGNWVSTSPISYNTGDVSIAYVNGRTFVCYAKTGVYEWDGTALVLRVLTGTGGPVNNATIRGISGAINYLIFFTDVSVYWSSLIDPLNFDPTANNGSGTQIPIDLRGQVNYILAQPGGFLIFGQYNTVSALYTQNAATPWIFREVKNAGGLTAKNFITTDNNSGAVYMWGTNGFQEVNLREATNLFPDLTDFLAGKIIEDFDPTTNKLLVTRLATVLDVKVTFVSGRYIVVSYGRVAGTYEYCLVYDMSLKRWGKLKFQHVEAFPGPFTQKQMMCLMRRDGSFVRVLLDFKYLADPGVLILGTYQIKRGLNICSEEVDCEVLDDKATFTLELLVSYDGANYNQSVGMLPYISKGTLRNFQRSVEGENLSLLFKGSFELATVVLRATKGAKF